MKHGHGHGIICRVCHMVAILVIKQMILGTSATHTVYTTTQTHTHTTSVAVKGQQAKLAHPIPLTDRGKSSSSFRRLQLGS